MNSTLKFALGSVLILACLAASTQSRRIAIEIEERTENSNLEEAVRELILGSRKGRQDDFDGDGDGDYDPEGALNRAVEVNKYVRNGLNHLKCKAF
jgi:hypothetical protein